MKRTPGMDDERLRRILRAGDPLADGEALDPVAAQAIRRRVLAASASGPRLGWGAVAVVATAALALAVGVVLWLAHPPGGGGRVAGERAAGETVPGPMEAEEIRAGRPQAPAPAEGLALAEGPPSGPEEPAAESVPPAAQEPVAPALTDGPRLAVTTGPLDEERPRHRQIQLTTTGGTRVVWVLNADVSI